MLTIDPRPFWTCSPISSKHMLFWCLFLDPQLTPHHSNILVLWIRHKTYLRRTHKNLQHFTHIICTEWCKAKKKSMNSQILVHSSVILLSVSLVLCRCKTTSNEHSSRINKFTTAVYIILDSCLNCKIGASEVRRHCFVSDIQDSQSHYSMICYAMKNPRAEMPLHAFHQK